jgi:sulfite exporter TauE/SafE
LTAFYALSTIFSPGNECTTLLALVAVGKSTTPALVAYGISDSILSASIVRFSIRDHLKVQAGNPMFRNILGAALSQNDFIYLQKGKIKWERWLKYHI